MKVIIFDPDTIDHTGHHFAYTQKLINELKDKNYQIFLISNLKKKIKFENLDFDFSICDFFSWEYYTTIKVENPAYTRKLTQCFNFLEVLSEKYKSQFFFYYYLGNYNFLNNLLKKSKKLKNIKFFVNIFNFPFQTNTINESDLYNELKKNQSIVLLSDSKNFRKKIGNDFSFFIKKNPMPYLNI